MSWAAVGTHTIAFVSGVGVSVLTLHYKDSWTLWRTGADTALVFRKHLQTLRAFEIDTAERMDMKKLGPDGPWRPIEAAAAELGELQELKPTLFHLRHDGLEQEIWNLVVNLIPFVGKGRGEIMSSVQNREQLFDENHFGTQQWRSYTGSIREHYVPRLDKLIAKLERISTPWAFARRRKLIP